MDDGLPQSNVKPDRASEEEEFGNLRQTHRQQMERLVEIEKESSALYQALDEVREVHRQAPRKESGGGRVPEVRTLPIQEERVREERTQIKRALRTLEEEKDEVQKILDDCSRASCHTMLSVYVPSDMSSVASMNPWLSVDSASTFTPHILPARDRAT